MKQREIELMTLSELQEEKRRLIRKLVKTEDATWNDAKRFKRCCDAIRYLQEMKNWADGMNRGKRSENQVVSKISLVQKYRQRWEETMPERGKETEQAFLHGQHWETGEILRDLHQLSDLPGAVAPAPDSANGGDQVLAREPAPQQEKL